MGETAVKIAAYKLHETAATYNRLIVITYNVQGTTFTVHRSNLYPLSHRHQGLRYLVGSC